MSDTAEQLVREITKQIDLKVETAVDAKTAELVSEHIKKLCNVVMLCGRKEEGGYYWRSAEQSVIGCLEGEHSFTKIPSEQTIRDKTPRNEMVVLVLKALEALIIQEVKPSLIDAYTKEMLKTFVRTISGDTTPSLAVAIFDFVSEALDKTAEQNTP